MLLSLLVLRMIVLVPDHCVSFYFTETNLKILWYYRVLLRQPIARPFTVESTGFLPYRRWGGVEEKGVDGESGLIL